MRADGPEPVRRIEAERISQETGAFFAAVLRSDGRFSQAAALQELVKLASESLEACSATVSDRDDR